MKKPQPKKAKIRIKDIKEENGVYLVSVEVKTYGYPLFRKAFKIEPGAGSFNIKDFKTNLKEVIMKEIEHRRKMAPLIELKDLGEFNLEL